MNKEQIECVRQIAETAGLLSQQFSKLADLLENDRILPYKVDPKNEDNRVEFIINPIDSTPVDGTIYSPMYYGAPSGNGFEESSELSVDSTKCLYIIQKISETKAKYYPIPEKLPRFKLNPNSLFYIVCMSIGKVEEASSITIEEKDYGELEYCDGYWKVIKKCIVLCY